MGAAVGLAHTLVGAAGMNGIHAAGDLVARMQISKGMKIREAKDYVADKMGVNVMDLSDEILMDEYRRDHNLATAWTSPGQPRGIEAKFHIARLLDIEINSVNKARVSMGI